MPKCKICKRDIPKGEAYIQPHITSSGTVVKYNYCSKDELESHNKDLDYKNKIYDTLKDYMEYDETQILPHVITKEVMSLRNSYTYRVIYNVIKDMEKLIRYWMNLDGKFNSDYQKARYLVALLSNNINDVYSKLKREAKVENNSNVENIDIDIIEEFEVEIKPRKITDISSFLD